MKNLFKAFGLAAGLLLVSGVARAQFAVVVVEDIAREIHWIEEDAEWSELLGTTASIDAQLGTANTTLGDSLVELRSINRRIGEPAEGSARAFESVSIASSASEDLIRRELSLETVMASDDGGDTLEKVNHTTKTAIGKSFEIDGDSYDRDQARYRLLEQEEKLREQYKQALKDFQAVQEKELDFQHDQSSSMESGTDTESEIQARHAAIESSRGRIELAKNRLEVAKAELDVFMGQLDLEGRKVEAARWEEKDKAKEVAHDQSKRTKTYLQQADNADEDYDF